MIPCVIRIDGAKVFTGVDVTIDRSGPEAGGYLLAFDPKAARPRMATIYQRASAKVFPNHASAKAMALLLPRFACSVLPQEDTAL